MMISNKSSFRKILVLATLFLSALMIYAIWVQNDLSLQIEEAQVREAEAAKLIQDYQLQLSNIEVSCF
jgi:hypothetical protein